MGIFSWFATGNWNKPGAVTPSSRALKASVGYNGASGGRRMSGWNGSILGPNTITLGDWQQLLRRSRDAIRNSAIASSAIQRFESNIIGTGIVPHFTHEDPDIRSDIQNAFDQWTKKADFAGQLSFYGLQSLLARELFEAGECFVRFHVVDEDDAYFQCQLIESEQVPVYLNMTQTGLDPNTVIKEGVIFDKNTDKRVGYRLYRGQPYDSVVNPFNGIQFITLSTDEMIHIMKPTRAGALRGTPMMASVLPLLYDIEGYADSERLRKRLASMFAFFITKPAIEDSVVPISNEQFTTDPGVDITKLEPGTMQELLPGESIVVPQVPHSPDYVAFMNCELHKFAAGVGLTYEQLTGDMTGVNYSSARVALLEFRRSAEQFQRHIIVNQFCAPILKKWMKEAVLAGELELPDDYVSNPAVYEACAWVGDGFGWTDPLKEVQSAQMSVRCGFTSRSMVIRQNGFDPATVDAEIAIERKREELLGIITDTNSNVVLIGKETQPLTTTQPDPSQDSNQEATQDTDSGS
jgi:lambda family phage portal protein